MHFHQLDDPSGWIRGAVSPYAPPVNAPDLTAFRKSSMIAVFCLRLGFTTGTDFNDSPFVTGTAFNDSPSVTDTAFNDSPSVTGTAFNDSPSVTDTAFNDSPYVTGTAFNDSPSVTGTAFNDSPSVTDTVFNDSPSVTDTAFNDSPSVIYFEFFNLLKGIVSKSCSVGFIRTPLIVFFAHLTNLSCRMAFSVMLEIFSSHAFT